MSTESPRTPITVEVRDRVLLTTFHTGATDEQYRAYLDEFTEQMLAAVARHGAVANINDATRWLRSSAVQRQLHADWIRRWSDYISRTTAGIAFVVSSPLVQGGLTAVLWLARMPAAHRVFRELPQAERWVDTQLSTFVPRAHDVRRSL